MRWVEERDIFDKVLVDARACVRVDEGQRVEQLGRLVFDSSELRTRAFFALLCALAQWSGDRIMYYLVLTPDPVSYFLHHFGKYPLLEIQANGSPEEYLTVLNEDPGGSPADAVGINWSQYIILPSSKGWFIRGLRDESDDAGGHLWVPEDWETRVVEGYPYARADANT